MAQKKDEDEVAKARRVVERAEKKVYNNYKKFFKEAAKKARAWRASGRFRSYESG